MTELRRSKFQAARTFEVTYGADLLDCGQTPPDVWIVEPTALSAADLSSVRGAGTLVLAYVSVLEVPEYDPLFPMLQDEDWLRLQDWAVRNARYGNLLADIRSPRWQGHLHHRVGRLLRRNGYDGVFLDTIGDLEWPQLAPLRQELTHAFAAWLCEVRALFPDHILVQNNGVEQLYEETATWLDAVCWENPAFYKPHFEWSRQVAAGLERRGRIQPGLRTLLLFEEGEGATRSLPEAGPIAERNGWLVHVARPDYR